MVEKMLSAPLTSRHRDPTPFGNSGTVPTPKFNVLTSAGAGRINVGNTSYGNASTILDNRRLAPVARGNLIGDKIKKPK